MEMQKMLHMLQVKCPCVHGYTSLQVQFEICLVPCAHLMASISDFGLLVSLAECLFPYSIDLHQRVVWFDLVHTFSSELISDLLYLSERTLCRHITLFHQTGDVKPVSRDGQNRPQKLLGVLEQIQLLQFIIHNSVVYLHELQDKLQEAFGVQVHSSMICRMYKFMDAQGR